MKCFVFRKAVLLKLEFYYGICEFLWNVTIYNWYFCFHFEFTLLHIIKKNRNKVLTALKPRIGFNTQHLKLGLCVCLHMSWLPWLSFAVRGDWILTQLYIVTCRCVLRGELNHVCGFINCADYIPFNSKSLNIKSCIQAPKCSVSKAEYTPNV